MDQSAARALNRDPRSVAVPKPNPRPNPKVKPIFVRSELDDFGLTGTEFLVLAHVARREHEVDGCYESVPNIARFLKLSDKTVTRVLMVLNEVGLIKEYDQTGDTTTRFINPIEQWIDNKDRLPGIRKRIYPDKSKSKKSTTQTSKPITPDTGDGGIQTTTPDTADGGAWTPEPLLPWTPEQGEPRTPQTDKGVPSEGSPVEGNPKKEIPHTHMRTVSEALAESTTETTVCVPEIIDIFEIRKVYLKAHSYPNSKSIKNPGGWLVHAATGKYDELILDWYREEERKAESRRTIRQKQEAAELEHQRQVDEERRQRAYEEQRLDEPISEDEQQRREQVRLQKEEGERQAAIEDCKRYWVQWANKPNLRDGFIRSTLPDERSREEFENWKAGYEQTRTKTAAA